jgi:hypothetical protein
MLKKISLLPIIILKKVTDIFMTRMKEQNSLVEKCLQLFIELFKYIQLISAKWESEEMESGIAYMEAKIDKLLELSWTQQTALNIIYVFK